MWKAVNAGLVGRPWLFAKNTMAIAMPTGNPAGIRSIACLARPGVLVGVCDVAVPCGAPARDLIARNRIHRDSRHARVGCAQPARKGDEW